MQRIVQSIEQLDRPKAKGMNSSFSGWLQKNVTLSRPTVVEANLRLRETTGCKITWEATEAITVETGELDHRREYYNWLRSHVFFADFESRLECSLCGDNFKVTPGRLGRRNPYAVVTVLFSRASSAYIYHTKKQLPLTSLKNGCSISRSKKSTAFCLTYPLTHVIPPGSISWPSKCAGMRSSLLYFKNGTYSIIVIWNCIN